MAHRVEPAVRMNGSVEASLRTEGTRGPRRRWRILLGWAATVLVVAVVAWGFVWEPARLVERDHTLALQRWPASCDGLRIDVVSDTHTGSPNNGLDNVDRWARRLADSDADIVLMAGDYVILSVFLGTYVGAVDIAAHLRPLTARKRVYAVLGNHDWWKDGDAVRDAFSAAGVTMVDNSARRVDVGACRFWLAGIGDLLEGHPDVAGTFTAIADDGLPVLVLTHEPDLLPQVPLRASLTIAGHTHGGQIDPWPPRTQPSAFLAHSHRLKWHVRDDVGRDLFVSPGIGTSIVPMRLGVPPEISRLTLRSAAKAADAHPARAGRQARP